MVQDRCQEDISSCGRGRADVQRPRPADRVKPVDDGIPGLKQQLLQAGGPTDRLLLQLECPRVEQQTGIAEAVAGLLRQLAR